MTSRAFCISKHAGCSDIRVQSKYAFGEAGPIGSTDGEAHEGASGARTKGNGRCRHGTDIFAGQKIP